MGVSLPAFQTLVDAHWRDVARLAHALAGPVDGDDVAQQAWTQALAAYPALRSSRNLRGWLLTITHRCAMDAHRSRARRAVPSEDVAALAHAGSTRAPVAPSPEASLPDTGLWGRSPGCPSGSATRWCSSTSPTSTTPPSPSALETTPAMSRRLVSDGLATLRKDLQ